MTGRDARNTILKTFAEGYYAVDAKWQIVHVNAFAEAHFGQPAARLLGGNLWRITGIPHDSLSYEKLHEVAKSGEPTVFQVESGVRTGRWFEVHVHPRPEGGLDIYFKDVTERRLAEKRIEESQAEIARHRAFLRTVVDSLSGPLMVRDRFGRCLLANEAAARFHGMAVERLEGSLAQEVPTLPPSAFELDQQMFTTRQEVVSDVDLVGADGQHHSFIVVRVPLSNADGVCDRVLVSALDVTWRRRAERALRNSEEKFAKAFKSNHACMCITSMDGTYIDVNDRFVEVTGYCPEQVIGKTTAELGIWKDPTAREEFVRQLERHGVVRDFETHFVRRNGEEWISSVACTVNDIEGERLLISSFTDITEQKRAEEAIRESEARFRSVLDRSRDVIYRLNIRTGKFEYVSPSAEAVVGYTADELLTQDGESSLAMIHPDDVRLMRAAVERVHFTGHAEVEYRQRTKSGEYRWLSNHMTLTNGADGRPLHRDGNIRDVTARREAEEALRQSDRRKDEFIAILSHELRNPLAPIRYALPLLERQKLDDAGASAVSVIDRQVDHLARLVDDLLDVSRITRGKIELRREYVTLSSVITAGAEAASPAIVAGRHRLALSIPDEPVWLHADPARIAQVVTNLLNNSAKYTPSGGDIHLYARVEPVTPPDSVGRSDSVKQRVVIAVRDNGMGIAPEALSTVFDMFTQAHTSDKAQGGLGIGLALVKRLVDMHGGTIEARSAGSNQGAEFLVTLPIVQPVGDAPSGKENAVSPANSKRLRVLIVDDNADLVEMLSMVVETAGHEVRKAFDGRSAVSAALSFKPHVLLLDLGLPGMSGLDVAREVRSHPEMGSTRLVALTGWGQPDDRRQTAAAGFHRHLTKPTDPEQLELLLSEIAASIVM